MGQGRGLKKEIAKKYMRVPIGRKGSERDWVWISRFHNKEEENEPECRRTSLLQKDQRLHIRWK